MVLSDRTIKRLLHEGRIEIDPYDPSLLQPSSVDVRVDRYFRVFHNARYPYIDVREPQEDLTELVEIDERTPFILHPGEFVLGSTLERVKLPDDLVARLEGKALALDTEVPTTRGWKTMGELQPGDHVFDEEGRPTVVVAATGAMCGRPCREVEFSDGTTVVCDVDHQWATATKGERRGAVWRLTVRTTAEIERSLLVRGDWNHTVPLVRPVRHPQRQIPLDPYVVGVRLAHATSTVARTTRWDGDIPAPVTDTGYAVAGRRTRPLAHRIGGGGETGDAPTGRYVRDASLFSTLRDAGLLGATPIPQISLHTSSERREALLSGPMEADGYVDRFGRCQLIANLGLRPTLANARSVGNGGDCRPTATVQFDASRRVSRRPWTLARQRPSRLHRFRSIVAVREVKSVPVRCIQVSSPRGLFLVTRSYIPTHNSSLGRLGLLIHSTAGFIDPGWDGHVTLELSNVANLPITIYYGMKIGQLSFVQLTEPAESPYGSAGLGSKYQGQRGPTPSRYWQNFKQEKTP